MNLPIILVILGQRAAEVAFNFAINRLTRRKTSRNMRSVVLERGKDSLISYLSNNPSSVVSPFWNTVKDLRVVTSDKVVNTTQTALAVSQLVQHFNTSECIIVARGLISNKYVASYTKVCWVIITLVVLKNMKTIIKFVITVYLDENEKPLGGITSAMLTAALLSAANNPDSVEAIIKSLDGKNQFVSDHLSHVKRISEAFKAS